MDATGSLCSSHSIEPSFDVTPLLPVQAHVVMVGLCCPVGTNAEFDLNRMGSDYICVDS